MHHRPRGWGALNKDFAVNSLSSPCLLVFIGTESALTGDGGFKQGFGRVTPVLSMPKGTNAVERKMFELLSLK